MPYEAEFEWDPEKAAANFEKHDVSFEFAIAVFQDSEKITCIDDRKDYGEIRFETMGYVNGRLYVVVHTMRGDCIRLISARKANPREQKKHDFGS